MKLNEYLKETGIPLVVFAKKAGISVATVNNIITNIKDMYLSVAIRIEETTKGQVTCRELISKRFNELGRLRDEKQHQKKPNGQDKKHD